MYKVALFLGVIVLPFIAFAQANGIKGIIQGIGSIVYMLIPVTATLALLYFFWGLAKFILHAGSDDAREEGKQVMKWGIVVLFVLVSIWGITRLLGSELGIRDILNISTSTR